MEKERKTFIELSDIQKLKINKVLKYQGINEGIENSVIILEEGKMKYVIIGEQIIDI